MLAAMPAQRHRLAVASQQEHHLAVLAVGTRSSKCHFLPALFIQARRGPKESSYLTWART
eukprot:scaffold140_cov247-Pinguiococcus_pyrenoidosus.AAC.12